MLKGFKISHLILFIGYIPMVIAFSLHFKFTDEVYIRFYYLWESVMFLLFFVYMFLKDYDIEILHGCVIAFGLGFVRFLWCIPAINHWHWMNEHFWIIKTVQGLFGLWFIGVVLWVIWKAAKRGYHKNKI